MNRVDLFGFALGVHATMGQVVLMREALALSGGNELAVGLGFAFWLTGVGLGAVLAGAVAKPESAQSAGAIVSPFTVVGGLLAFRLHREMLDLSPGVDPSLSNLCALLSLGLGAGGFTVGFLFTSAARASAGGEKTPVSRLYAAEAVGALVGGLVFTFALSGVAPHLAVIGLAGCLPLCSLAVFGGRNMRIAAGSLFVSIVLATAFGLIGKADRWSQIRAFSQLGASGELVAAKDSRYSRLALGESENEYHLFVDGRLDHTFPDPWERPILIHVALAQHPEPRSVLIIGGGPADRLESALAHKPKKVVITYLDEGVEQLCGHFWPLKTVQALRDPRVTVVHDDGRRYVSKTSEKFDVVIVSAKPPLSGQANRYHTREFFLAVRRVLNKGGTMTSLASGGATVLAPEAARSAASSIATVKSVFSEVIAVPGLETVIQAATDKGVVTARASELKTRYEARDVGAYSFSSRRFDDMFDSERMAKLSRELERWPKVVNKDLTPLVYLAGLQLWERSLTGKRSADDPTWTGLTEKWALAWLVVPLVLWLSWQFLAVASKRRGLGAPTISIAATGAAGMACEIMVLFAFQSASGILYTGLALLLALFMAGLFMGAYFGRRYLSGGARIHGIVADEIVLVFLLISGPFFETFYHSAELVAFWSLVSGAVTGSAFPALLGLAAKRGSGDERGAAAAIEAADHFGAAVGALITGVVWIPVFGVAATCLLFACFKLASLLGLVFLREIKT